jgi:hypothetical protein
MAQHMADKDLAPVVVNCRYQAIFVARYIKSLSVNNIFANSGFAAS